MEDVTKVTSSYIIGTEEFSSGGTMFPSGANTESLFIIFSY